MVPCKINSIVESSFFLVWRYFGTKEQSDPTARYTLNLMHPQHRALLRMLLRLSFCFEEIRRKTILLIRSENKSSVGDVAHSQNPWLSSSNSRSNATDIIHSAKSSCFFLKNWFDRREVMKYWRCGTKTNLCSSWGFYRFLPNHFIMIHYLTQYIRCVAPHVFAESVQMCFCFAKVPTQGAAIVRLSWGLKEK